MKKLRLFLILISFALIHQHNGLAQDIQFSQFYNMGIYYNPAVTCMDNDVRATLALRKQWANIQGGLTNYYAGVESKVYQKKVYLSLLVMNKTVQDYLSTTRAEIMYAYRTDLRRAKIQFGLTLFSINERTINYDALQYSDQLDPVYGVVNPTSAVFDQEQNVYYPDWNAGFVIRGKERRTGSIVVPTFGFSAQHLFRPNISTTGQDARLATKYVIHGDFLFTFKLYNRISSHRPEVLVKPAYIIELQEPFQTFTIGASAYAFNFNAGLWFRTWDTGKEGINTVILSLGADIPVSDKSALGITYSYDATVSDLEFSTGGSHEISLQYKLDYVLRFIDDCPRRIMKTWKEDKKSAPRPLN